MTSLIRSPIRRGKILCLLCFVTEKLRDFPCVFGIYLFTGFFKFGRFQYVRVLSLYCFQKGDANSKFFQLPTCTYDFVLAAFVHLNIDPFVV